MATTVRQRNERYGARFIIPTDGCDIRSEMYYSDDVYDLVAVLRLMADTHECINYRIIIEDYEADGDYSEVICCSNKRLASKARRTVDVEVTGRYLRLTRRIRTSYTTAKKLAASDDPVRTLMDMWDWDRDHGFQNPWLSQKQWRKVFEVEGAEHGDVISRVDVIY